MGRPRGTSTVIRPSRKATGAPGRTDRSSGGGRGREIGTGGGVGGVGSSGLWETGAVRGEAVGSRASRGKGERLAQQAENHHRHHWGAPPGHRPPPEAG